MLHLINMRPHLSRCSDLGARYSTCSEGVVNGGQFWEFAGLKIGIKAAVSRNITVSQQAF